ncbi:MAG: 3-hydroxyacyl-ACP dehydratase FabZ [Deltaproteobacteria bacterium]|nr:3-hydroxyacyl-ACP dehydratase FabZ [Deltaproteobacteria bacterium]
MVELPLYVEDIKKILPHRYPFLLVDRITELELGKRIVGFKCVTVNEPFFQGHFPMEPIMPGVLIIEGMAQTGGVLGRVSVMETEEIEPGNATFFMAIDKVKFRRPVVPGDQLVYEITALRTGSRVWKVEGKARVDNEVAAEAQLVAQVG